MQLRTLPQKATGLLLIAIAVAGCAVQPPSAASQVAAIATPTTSSLTTTSATSVEAPAVPTRAATSESDATAPWTLVAVGDSIPFNSSDDCPGCNGFVNRYATAVTDATGHPVTVENLSQHNGLQIDGLLRELTPPSDRASALVKADIIIVGIGGNDRPWNRNDDPCDGAVADPDWSKYNATCVAAAADMFRPKLESLYAQIAALRAGKPTILRTITSYNDWIGGPGTPPEATTPTKLVVDAWSAMVCKAAQASGFMCADIYHAFGGPDGLTPALDLLAKDYTHPSDEGNAVIAAVLTDLGYEPLSTAKSPAGATSAALAARAARADRPAAATSAAP